MEPFTINVCLIACFVCLFVIVNGVREGKEIHDLEIHQQLKILKKTIKTEGGIIYDCFDIYKQSAFNNPLLKNHKIQMKPSCPPKDVRSPQLPANTNVSKVGLDEGCPHGTVPIMRTNKEYVLRANLFMKSLQARLIPTINKSPGFHYAGKILGSKPDQQYFGASSYINTYNPNVTKNQFSAAITLLQSGPPDKPDHILFGWMVNPALFGDSSTRTFGAWIASGSQGCFDTACSGFVQVNPSVPINLILDKVSVVGGVQYESKFTVTKDPKTGNWMLYYGSNNDYVGYWPNTLFSSLSNSASEVIWGGESFTNDDISPPMGSGFFAEVGINKAAYIRELQVANKDNEMGDPQISLLNYYADSPNCYNSGPWSGQTFSFFFGGPGGHNC